MKKIIKILKNRAPHWVGDGFPVKSLMAYHQLGAAISPFLLLDHAGPHTFDPAKKPRGVGDHPHRGFETVTISYEGEVSHKDSGGNEGTIGPGDVQWMTAGSGVIHQEFHSQNFTSKGGLFHMVQLWINLPAKYKMSKPQYQTLLKNKIPVVNLKNEAGTLRVIGGEYLGTKGPAHTYSAVNVLDIELWKNKTAELRVKEGFTTTIVILSGEVKVNSGDTFDADTVLILAPQEETFTLEASNKAQILLLNGAPIAEPIVGYGPFVMNTKEQIEEAISDFNKGKFIQTKAEEFQN